MLFDTDADFECQHTQHLGFEDIQNFMEASEGRAVRLHLCNPNLMALEHTSVAFAHLKVPGIFVSQNTLQITVESVGVEDEDDRLSPSDSEDEATVEEDWEHQVTASSPSDKEPLTPNGEDSVLLPEGTAIPATKVGNNGRNDESDTFTPVVNRQKKNSHISKVGVRLAVVTSNEFDKFHKPASKISKSRGTKNYRGTSALKATTVASSTGTATYREVDYQNMKKLNPRPCHKHYLSVKGCPNGRDCAFGHHYELTSSELLAVRVLAREMPCPYHLNGGLGCPNDVSNTPRHSSAPRSRLIRVISRSILVSNTPAYTGTSVQAESKHAILLPSTCRAPIDLRTSSVARRSTCSL